MPRLRKQTARYGNQDQVMNMSELDTSDSDSELDDAGQRVKKGSKGSKSGRRGRRKRGDDESDTEGPIESYTRSDCFKVEKNLLIYGYGVSYVLYFVEYTCSRCFVRLPFPFHCPLF